MKIQDITSLLEKMAPLALQENYDNAGLITGMDEWECSGILVALDATEEIVTEAIQKKCNLVIAHHPIIFKGLKKINGINYVEKSIIAAIKNDIAIYAIHTNLDNIQEGVNGKIAEMIGLVNTRVLAPKEGVLQKLSVFVPEKNREEVSDAMFTAGAGHIGNYSECSFITEGTGTFKAGENTDPYVGKVGKRHRENEVKIEVIFPTWLSNRVIQAMIKAHPYEEPAYDIYGMVTNYRQAGSGICGILKEGVDELDFLQAMKNLFKTPFIKHTNLTGKKIKKVALCGGAGSFMIKDAINWGADIYITSDIKYHEFFDAGGKMIIADIGHYESEQFTIDLLADFLRGNFPNFAILKTGISTNPVHYFQG